MSMGTPIEPLTPEVVDELLSADLDGDFDAAAREHGYAPAIARELLAADPAVVGRRAVLAATRDAMSVAPLAPDERSRLLAGATESAPDDALMARRRRRNPTRVVAALAAIAAVVALVVGVGAVLTSRGDDSGNDSSAASAGDSRADSSGGKSASESAVSAAPTFDFGAATDDQQLRARIEAALANPTAPANDGPSAPQFSSGPAPVAPGSTRADCVRAQADATGTPGQVLLRGPVTYKGASAEVFLFEDGDATIALVIDDTDAACRLVSEQLLRPGS
jgi:hypothetical protein